MHLFQNPLRHPLLSVCALLLTGHLHTAALDIPEETASTENTSVEQWQAQLGTLRDTYDSTRHQIHEIRSSIEQSDAIAPLKAAFEEADHTYKYTERENVALRAAKTQEHLANHTYNKMIYARIAEDSTGKNLLDQQKSIRNSIRLDHFERDLAWFYLTNRYSDVHLATEQNDSVKAARAQYEIDRRSSERSVRDKAGETFNKVRDAFWLSHEEAGRHFEIVRQFNERRTINDKDLRETESSLKEMYRSIERSGDEDIDAARKTRDAAHQAVRDCYASDPILTARAKRDAARQRYHTARDNALSAHEHYASLHKQEGELKVQIRALEKKIHEHNGK